MNLFLIYLIVGFLASNPTEQEKKTQRVSGIISTSGSYCGGVAPLKKMLETIQATKPMGDFMIYVKKGSTNKISSCIIDSTYADSNENYSFDLRPGKYVLLQKEQLNKHIFETCKSSKSIQVDIDCMQLWWEKGLSNITVENENIDSLNFHFQKRCFVPLSIPCLKYIGYYPP